MDERTFQVGCSSMPRALRLYGRVAGALGIPNHSAESNPDRCVVMCPQQALPVGGVSCQSVERPKLFRVWPRLRRRLLNTLYENAIIATTAKRRKLIVVARNIGRCSHIDVDLFHPFKSRSG